MRDRERYEKRVGTVVDGRWRVERLLGLGSTSAVYAATHRNGHRAALKILHQSLCSDTSMLERFLGEAGIANAIKHRAIVPIRDDGTTEDGCTYLVVELLEGDTLEALRERRKGRLEVEELAPIAEELMSALAAVHAAGVVHRDLKPQNVFLTGTGELKLLDFGTARIFDRAAGSAVSAAGMVIGTPAFMSPEQAKGARAEVDAQSDVWSLGAMLFTLLSGEYVHLGRDAHARLLTAASKPARKLADVAPSIDDRVATVIDRALAFAKEERWADVRAMRVAFREAVVASCPTMRDLTVFAAHDAGADEHDEESVAGTVSMSEPTLAAASLTGATFSVSPPPLRSVLPPAQVDERASESEIPSVSSTQRIARARTGIPVPALVLGIGAMAAVVMLVAFFVHGGDASTRGAAAGLADPTKVAAAPPVAPASSFIVIEAPDLAAAEKKKPSPPAWVTAPAPPRTKKEPASASADSASKAASEPDPKSAEPLKEPAAAPIAPVSAPISVTPDAGLSVFPSSPAAPASPTAAPAAEGDPP